MVSRGRRAFSTLLQVALPTTGRSVGGRRRYDRLDLDVGSRAGREGHRPDDSEAHEESDDADQQPTALLLGRLGLGGLGLGLALEVGAGHGRLDEVGGDPLAALVERLDDRLREAVVAHLGPGQALHELTAEALHVRGGRAARGVIAHTLLDELANGREHGVVIDRGTAQLPQALLLALGVPGGVDGELAHRDTGDELVERRTEGVDVHGRVGFESVEGLWRHVEGRADGERTGASPASPEVRTGGPEVEHLHGARHRQDDVARLDVPVDDAQRWAAAGRFAVVRGVEGVGDLHRDAYRDPRGEGAMGLHDAVEGEPLDVLHHDGGPAIDLRELLYTNDVVVVQPPEQHRLVTRPLEDLVVADPVGLQDLEDDRALERALGDTRDVDLPERPLAKGLEDLGALEHAHSPRLLRRARCRKPR